MKISELVQELEQILYLHGDLLVVTVNSSGTGDVDEVRLAPIIDLTDLGLTENHGTSYEVQLVEHVG